MREHIVGVHLSVHKHYTSADMKVTELT